MAVAQALRNRIVNYMNSLNAAANSTTSLIVDFDVKTDPNTDFILAQSRETQAASQLPVDVTNYGITVRKSVTAPLIWVALYSPHGTYDANFLANYAYINLTDPILRSPGIGNTTVFGSGQYAMRLWVKPDTLSKLGITVPEIISAILAQNTVNPAGKAGGEPAPKGSGIYLRFSRRAASSRPKNLATLSFAKLPTAESSGSAM
jgi:HAE1 family hydrophobic/amphiphilic exporter-1